MKIADEIKYVIELENKNKLLLRLRNNFGVIILSKTKNIYNGFVVCSLCKFLNDSSDDFVICEDHSLMEQAVSEFVYCDELDDFIEFISKAIRLKERTL